ncbi:hypothetical protein CfE428DRAFT_0106 [Chthoniobacter flavus Ellin428]|uniref:Uncharacterized protein n=1 Tax=Chthoniobacter flavus Ellin428 TaxID=497964 RepID=B4CTU3_9BACT|nr:hypothetical protein [Chthoniobacter flavus]EDY21981.1 hypothetical protein CfE428DRAFT_0106 [Chthoniobacter flavus Ellin428]
MRRHPWLTAPILFVVLCEALYIAVEWHAESRWRHYAVEAQARGVKLYPADFIRPEIPDAENFAALPRFKNALAAEKFKSPFILPSTPRSTLPVGPAKAYLFDDGPPAFGNMRKGEKIDWQAWRKYFLAVGFPTEASDDPVRDVLHALDHFAPQFQEWSEWRTSRPRCQLPIGPVKGKGFYSTIFADAAAFFRLRISAHLADGDSATAYADFQDGCQAPRALKNELGLVNAVLRVGMMHFLLDAVGGGLQEHAWRDTELQKIERDLAALDLWEDYRASLAGARGQLNQDIETMMNQTIRERRRSRSYQLYFSDSWTVMLFQIMPRSVFRDNELRMNRYIDELLAPGSRSVQTFDPERKTPSSSTYLASAYDKRYYFLSDPAGKAYSFVGQRFLRLQTVVDQARLACALERFRLARGSYPGHARGNWCRISSWPCPAISTLARPISINESAIPVSGSMG